MCKQKVCDSVRANEKYHIEVVDYLAQQTCCRNGCKASVKFQTSKQKEYHTIAEMTEGFSLKKENFLEEMKWCE